MLRKKCFDNVSNFTEAFLLSIETSMIIGYSGCQVTSECPHDVILLMIQALSSSLIEACIIGLIFAKIARPGKRNTTVLFHESWCYELHKAINQRVFCSFPTFLSVYVTI